MVSEIPTSEPFFMDAHMPNSCSIILVVDSHVQVPGNRLTRLDILGPQVKVFSLSCPDMIFVLLNGTFLLVYDQCRLMNSRSPERSLNYREM